METKTVVFVVALSLFSAFTVNALTCYQCTGVNEGACFDPEGENVTEINCETSQGPGDYVCFKIIFTNDDKEYVNRGCYKEANFDTYCNTFTGTEDKECLTCTEDLCNSSNKFGVVSFTVLAFCLLLAKLF